MAEQKLLWASEGYAELDAWLEEKKASRVLLVSDSSLSYLRLNGYFARLEESKRVKLARFSEFQPNPLYESVVEGVKRYREAECEAIIAVGGGSAIDVAKCIKLYAGMNPAENYLKQEIVANEIPLLAIPTTAGTGSEATRYAVIYYEGEKQSITHESILPGTVLMDASALRTLPEYQKKSTMLDALCHAIESFWSVNSTAESKQYSRRAIGRILENMEGYLSNEEAGNAGMLEAAHVAGQAINITQTTAGHAMCYKLTSLYGIAHGHAAALCVAKLWPYMNSHTQRCIDARGEKYLKETLDELGRTLGGKNASAGAEKFEGILASLQLRRPAATEGEIAALATSVNPVRLKNNPVQLDEAAIASLYREILDGNGDRE